MQAPIVVVRWPLLLLALLLSLTLPLRAQEGDAPAVPGVAEGTAEGSGAPPAPDEGTGAAAPSEESLPSADEVMDHLNDLYRSDSSHALLTMEVVTEHWARTLEMEAWTVGEDDALIIIRAPAREAGTATLKTDEGLWNYAPRADRLMRIPSGLLSESWMGSHFTNDDIIRESDYSDDFDTTLSWHEEGGERYLLATSIPHPDAAVVWSKIEFLMTADRWIPVRADYFDDGDLVRTMEFSDIQEVDARPIPMTMLLVPHNEPGEHTRVTYDELDLNVPVDDSLFTQRGLRREAQRR